MLLCHSNHSALVDSLHAPTQPYTTTYPCMLLCHSNQSQLVSLTDSELPLYCGRYSRIGYRPSHFHHLSGLFRCCLFAGFIMSIVCLLAGIATARPSAFVEGTGFEPVMCETSPLRGYYSYAATFAFDLSANLPLFPLVLQRLILLSLHQPLQFSLLNHSVDLVLRICPAGAFLFAVWPYH